MSNERINVTKPFLPPIGQYIKEIESIWENHWLTHTGPKHTALEESLKSYLKTKNVSLFTNGHMALELAIEALELDGEIITTPFTFASTTYAIMRNGLTPVFCDIEPDTYTIDAEKIESLITEKTSAIVPVHVYGNVCDYKKIAEIAAKYNLKVIYDAAHAFGTFVDGISVAALGDISMFSFHATKVFHTIEGGCLTFDDESLGARLADIRQFGLFGKEDSVLAGTNAKMNEFQAAMGLCNLKHIDDIIKKRKTLDSRYRKNLDGLSGIKLCPEQKHVQSSYSYFPIQVIASEFNMSRDQLSDRLKEENIYTRKYFYPLTSAFKFIADKFNADDTPVAKEIADNILTLPLYFDLQLDDVDRICDILWKCGKTR